MLLQICDEGRIATATPITEEGLALLLLHILQVLDYLQAGVLCHLVLFCLWIAAELWHHQHVRSQGQHLLRHPVRDLACRLPFAPGLVYLVTREIDLCLSWASSISHCHCPRSCIAIYSRVLSCIVLDSRSRLPHVKSPFDLTLRQQKPIPLRIVHLWYIGKLACGVFQQRYYCCLSSNNYPYVIPIQDCRLGCQFSRN